MGSHFHDKYVKGLSAHIRYQSICRIYRHDLIWASVGCEGYA